MAGIVKAAEKASMETWIIFGYIQGLILNVEGTTVEDAVQDFKNRFDNGNTISEVNAARNYYNFNHKFRDFFKSSNTFSEEKYFKRYYLLLDQLKDKHEAWEAVEKEFSKYKNYEDFKVELQKYLNSN